MKRMFLAVCILWASVAQAQLWSNVVAPSRAVDWSRPGVAGGIPVNRTQCGSTIAAGTSAATINSDIAGCAANTYVLLGAGTFNLSSGLLVNSQNNVTIRGSGASSTFLVFSGANSCQGLYADICVQSMDVNWKNGLSNGPVSWTGGLSKGSTTITLSSTPNLKIGNPLILDQTDTTVTGCDIGGAPVSEITTTCTAGSPTLPGINGPYSLQGNNGGAQRATRNQSQIVTVTGCDGLTTPGHTCSSGTNITINPGIYMANWASVHTPQGWWATNPVCGVGVEDLSMDNSGSLNTPGTGAAIAFFNACNSWVKGVRSMYSSRAHVEINYSNRITVDNSYFFVAVFSTSTSYGVECEDASDLLIENNIFQGVSGPLTIDGNCPGTVLGYNFDTNDFYSSSPGYINAMSNVHTAGTDSILYEGNIGPQIYGDNFHGSHNLVTVFRNYISGNLPACWVGGGTTYQTASWGACTPASPIQLNAFTRFFNIIGNVLGQTGSQTSYINGNGTAIYSLGGGDSSAGVTVPNDSNVQSTVMLWGNYDTVNAATRFVSSEVPAALTGSQSALANLVPSSTILPASFYYSSTPSWWPSGKPWPLIGPDVTGGNVSGVGGHANTNPAQDCYLNLMHGATNGTGGPYTFSENSCYSASQSTPPPPQPPTNLSVIVN
jgi:hypothetical protein